MSDSPTETDVTKTDQVEATSTDTGVTTDSPPANDGDKADSPPAKDDGAKKSLADVIHDVVNKPTEGSPPSKTDDPDKAADTGDAEKPLTEADAPELNKEEMGQLSQKTARRMRYLTDKIEAESNKAKAMEPEVTEYRKFKTFLQDNRVSPDDATKALELAAMIVNAPPSEALEELLPIVQRLQEQAGEVLPTDLAEKLRAGYITEADAKETARLRATVKYKDEREARDRDESKQQQMQSANEGKLAIQKAVSNWENGWAKSDPDYSKLQSEVDIEINGRLALAKRDGKLPRTPEAAVSLMKECLKAVKDRKLRAQPPKEEMRHISGRSAASVDKTSRAPDLATHILQLGI